MSCYLKKSFAFLGYISKVTMRIVEEMMIMTIMMAGQQTILPKPLHYCGLVMITIITSTNNINGERKSFTFRGRSVAELINEWLHCKYIFVTCLFWQSSGLIIIVTSKSISLNFSLSAWKCSKLTFRVEGVNIIRQSTTTEARTHFTSETFLFGITVESLRSNQPKMKEKTHNVETKRFFMIIRCIWRGK